MLAFPLNASPVATTLRITTDLPENTQPFQFYRVEVNANANGLALAGQRITVECDSGVSCETTLDSAGNGACELASRTAGTRTLTARFAGAPLFQPATDTESHNVATIAATPPANPAFELRSPGYGYAVSRLSNGDLLVGGRFNRIGDTPRRGIVRLDANGAADPAYQADVIGSVYDVARGPNDSAYVFGSFTAIDGVLRRIWRSSTVQEMLLRGLRRVPTSTTRRKHLSIPKVTSFSTRLPITSAARQPTTEPV